MAVVPPHVSSVIRAPLARRNGARCRFTAEGLENRHRWSRVRIRAVSSRVGFFRSAIDGIEREVNLMSFILPSAPTARPSRLR